VSEGRNVQVAHGKHVLAAVVDDVAHGGQVFSVMPPLSSHLSHAGDIGVESLDKGQFQAFGLEEARHGVVQRLPVEVAASNRSVTFPSHKQTLHRTFAREGAYTLPRLLGKTPLSGKCFLPSSYDAHALNMLPNAAS
jgi:hypothetical protein